MKKIVSLLLTVCLACMAVPAPAEEPSPLGTWYLVRSEIGGLVIDAAGMMEVKMTINEDGTGTLTITSNGREPEPTGAVWTAADGGIDVTDETGATMTLQYDGEELLMDMDGMSMVFSHTPPEVSDAALPEKVPAENAGQFDGRWIVSGVVVRGIVGSAGENGAEDAATLEIENGRIVESAMSGDERVETEFTGEFTDGFLKVTVTAADGTPVEATYALLEDGRLTCVVNEVTRIYTRITEEGEEPAT